MVEKIHLQQQCKDETEKYNGTSWTEVNDLNTAKEGLAGFGASNFKCSIAGGGQYWICFSKGYTEQF